jgi:hypothetical protein
MSNLITDYVADGFEKVSDVYYEYSNDQFGWSLYNYNEDLLWSDHRSWIYFIVSDQTIMKVGETSQPLGIKSDNCLLVGDPTNNNKYTFRSIAWYQPIPRTTNRFGRLCNFCGDDDTDWHIRTNLQQDVIDGKVSLWARKCPLITVPTTVASKVNYLNASIHKDLELAYIDLINPQLNKGRK